MIKTLTRKPLVAVWCGFAFALLALFAHDALAQNTSQMPSQQQEGSAQANPNDPVSLLGQLNLSQEQVAQMRSIQSESVPQAQALTRRLNQARRALDEAIYSDNVDESIIEQRSRDVADAQAAVIRFRAQTELRVRRVLTSEQLQTFRDLRREVRREQRVERQLNRGVTPNRLNNPNRINQRPNAPATQTPRERRRNMLGKP